jgi:hypothetical protein
VRDLPLLKTPGGTILASQRSGIRGMSVCKSLATASDVVLFSAAYTMQGGTNHLNEQPHTYWARLFAEHGFAPFDLFRPFFWGNDKVCFWYRQNVFLYIKKHSDPWERIATQGFKEIPDVRFMNCIHPDLYNPKAQIGLRGHLNGLFPSLLQAVLRRMHS